MIKTEIATLYKALDICAGGRAYWDKDSAVEFFASAARRIARASPSRSDPYTGYYLRNIVRGDQPMTRAVFESCLAFLEKEGKAVSAHGTPSSRSDQKVTARPDTEAKVVEGTLILADSVLCPCGVWFTPVVPNQLYHTEACKREEYKRRRQQST